MDSKQIAKMNDLLRTTFMTGRVILTIGVQSSPDREEVITAVREFNDFNNDNDPHREHDFGQVIVNDVKYFWKIDYYDEHYEYGVDPYEDDEKVRRVLTIMRADEY